MWCHIFKHTQLPHIVTSSHKYVDHQVCDIYGWTLILIALILIANVELKPMWDFQTNSIFYLECDKDASIFVCTSQHLIGVNCCVSVSTWLVMSIFIYQSAHLLMSISWQPSSQDLVPGNPVRQGTLGSQGNFFFFQFHHEKLNPWLGYDHEDGSSACLLNCASTALISSVAVCVTNK